MFYASAITWTRMNDASQRGIGSGKQWNLQFWDRTLADMDVPGDVSFAFEPRVARSFKLRDRPSSWITHLHAWRTVPIWLISRILCAISSLNISSTSLLLPNLRNIAIFETAESPSVMLYRQPPYPLFFIFILDIWSGVENVTKMILPSQFLTFFVRNWRKRLPEIYSYSTVIALVWTLLFL